MKNSPCNICLKYKHECKGKTSNKNCDNFIPDKEAIYQSNLPFIMEKLLNLKIKMIEKWILDGPPGMRGKSTLHAKQELKILLSTALTNEFGSQIMPCKFNIIQEFENFNVDLFLSKEMHSYMLNVCKNQIDQWLGTDKIPLHLKEAIFNIQVNICTEEAAVKETWLQTLKMLQEIYWNTEGNNYEIPDYC